MNLAEAEELVRARLAYYEGEYEKAVQLRADDWSRETVMRSYQTMRAELVLLLHTFKVSHEGATRLEQLGNMRLYGTHGPKLRELGPNLEFVASGQGVEHRRAVFLSPYGHALIEAARNRGWLQTAYAVREGVVSCPTCQVLNEPTRTTCSGCGWRDQSPGGTAEVPRFEDVRQADELPAGTADVQQMTAAEELRSLADELDHVDLEDVAASRAVTRIAERLRELAGEIK